MTWKHVVVLMACLASVISCGLHVACIAVLPQIVTLATFLAGGVIGDVRSVSAPLQDKKDPPNVEKH